MQEYTLIKNNVFLCINNTINLLRYGEKDNNDSIGILRIRLAPGPTGIDWDPRLGMWREVMVEALLGQSLQSGPPQRMSPGMRSSQG